MKQRIIAFAALLIIITVVFSIGCTGQPKPEECKSEPFEGKYNPTLIYYKYQDSPCDIINIKYSINGEEFHGSFRTDYIPSLNWIKQNTPPDTIFLSWWDYGHMIRGYAERDVIVYSMAKELMDANAIKEYEEWKYGFSSLDRLVDVAHAFVTTDNQETNNIMQKYNATYIFFSREDYFVPGKGWAMFKVLNINQSDYVTTYATGEQQLTTLGTQTMLHRLLNNINNSYELVYQDEVIKIYKKS